jgi:hypothetical protein
MTSSLNHFIVVVVGATVVGYVMTGALFLKVRGTTRRVQSV